MSRRISVSANRSSRWRTEVRSAPSRKSAASGSIRGVAHRAGGEPRHGGAVPPDEAVGIEREGLVRIGGKAPGTARHLRAQHAIGCGQQRCAPPRRCGRGVGGEAEARRCAPTKWPSTTTSPSASRRPAARRPSARSRTSPAARRSTKRWVSRSCSASDSRSSIARVRSCQCAASSSQSGRCDDIGPGADMGDAGDQRVDVAVDAVEPRDLAADPIGRQRRPRPVRWRKICASSRGWRVAHDLAEIRDLADVPQQPHRSAGLARGRRSRASRASAAQRQLIVGVGARACRSGEGGGASRLRSSRCGRRKSRSLLRHISAVSGSKR